jgi:hypothetical protein
VCRFETATEASTVGQPCAEREMTDCDPLGADAQAALDATLASVLSGCFLNENILEVELQAGCATRFVLTGSRPDALECVADVLGSRRYACALELECARAEVSTLR